MSDVDTPAREVLLHLGELGLHRVGDGDRVLARLLEHLKADGALAVGAHARAQLLEAVLDGGDVATGARAEPSLLLATMMLADVVDVLELADRAHADLVLPFVVVAGRDGQVGGAQLVLDRLRGVDAERVEARAVEVDVDLARRRRP